MTRRRLPTIPETIATWRERATAIRANVVNLPSDSDMRLSGESIAASLDRHCDALQDGRLTFAQFYRRINEIFDAVEAIERAGGLPVVRPEKTH